MGAPLPCSHIAHQTPDTLLQMRENLKLNDYKVSGPECQTVTALRDGVKMLSPARGETGSSPGDQCTMETKRNKDLK